MEAEVYPNPRVIEYISSRFIPVKAHIKEQAPTFQKYNVPWTPTQLILDAGGVERHRIEGFLPVDDFMAQLTLGLGKLHLHREEYPEAENQLRSVCKDYPKTGAAPEACYWAGVAVYKRTHDAADLAATARELKARYPDSEWTRKSVVWSP